MSDQGNDSEGRPVGELLRERFEHLLHPLPSDAAASQAMADEEPRRRNTILAKLIDTAGSGFARYKLSVWQATLPKQLEVRRAVEEWWQTFPQRREAREGLVLYGPVGTGKDHLAFGAVAAAVMEHGCTAGFRNGRELMAEYRDRIGSDKSETGLLDSLIWQHVLILSDPLPVRGELTDFQADVLYRLVDGRASSGLITVCTLNVANDEEADRRLGAATWDRLCDRAWKLGCFWDSYRRPSREVLP